MINLRELWGHKYRIGYDIAVQSYPELKTDPDYQILLCRYGEIYVYSSKLLAVWVRGGKRIKKMREEIPGLIVHNNGEGEAVFLFKPELLDKVGGYIGIRKRRQLSAESKGRLIRIGQATQFHPQTRRKTAVPNARNDELPA